MVVVLVGVVVVVLCSLVVEEDLLLCNLMVEYVVTAFSCSIIAVSRNANSMAVYCLSHVYYVYSLKITL